MFIYNHELCKIWRDKDILIKYLIERSLFFVTFRSVFFARVLVIYL